MSAPGLDTPQAGPSAYPPAPDGLTAYIVGDVHGRADLLAGVQQLIDRDKMRSRPDRAVEIYLGDYIDRGPDSAGVVSRLIDRASDVEAVFLRGNHEQMLLDFLDGKDCLEEWRAVGGITTMLSYGVPPSVLTRLVAPEVVRRHVVAKIPREHLHFCEQTLPYWRMGQYLAVHAGVRPGIRLEEQKVSDLLGIRHDFLRYEGTFDFIVVHGHTVVMAPDLRSNRINIDTGAFATNRLTCLRVGDDGARVLAQ